MKLKPSITGLIAKRLAASKRWRALPIALVILIILAIAILVSQAASATWSATPTNSNWVTGASDNNWSTGTNTFPGSTSVITSGDTATFTGASTQLSIAINSTTLNIKSITFSGSSEPAYTIGTTGGNSLFLTNSGSISIASGTTGASISNTVNAPLVLEPASSSAAGSYSFSNASSTASHPLVIGGTVTGGTTTQGIALTMQGANTGANAINGAISDGGASAGVSLTKDANGTWALSGSNSYTGGTTLASTNGGILKLSGSGTLGSTSGTLTVNGGTLDLNGTAQGVGNLTGTGGTILNNATGTNVTLTGGNNNGTGGNYQGVIANNTSGTGTVAFTKTGNGTLTLSGANTYTGATTINAGTLTCGAANTIPSGSSLVLNGGTLQSGATTGFTQSTGTLTLSDNSTIALGTGIHSLTFAASNGVSWTAAKTLAITGWTGGYDGTSGTAGKIFVGSTSSGLTAAQLSQIVFFNGTSNFPATILSTGEVVPNLAPPSISKSFGTSPINVGGTSLLTVTVTNPNSSTTLTGVGFTDTLPTGLVFPTNLSTGQCGGTATITGLNTLTLSGASVPAGVPCTTTLSVTANGTATGVITNNTSNVTSTNGGTGNSASAQITVNDTTPPTISYTPLADTASKTNRALSVTVTDASGVPTSGTGLPVIYFRKGSSGSYSPTTCSFVSGSTYGCTIDYSLVSGGSVVNGDTIQYFVAAQDSATSPNVTTNPATGASGFGANPPSASTPTTAPNAYTVTNTDEVFSADGNLPAGTYHDVTINGCPTNVTLTGNVTINGTVTLNDCSNFYTNNFIVSGPGAFVMNAGTWLHITDANGITSGTTLSGNIQVTGGRTFPATANYDYDGGTNQVVGNGLPGTVNDLLVSNNGPGGNNTVTGAGGQVVTTLLEIIQGIYSSHSDYNNVTIDSGATLSLTADITVSGTWTNNNGSQGSGLVANGHKVTFDGNTNQTIRGTTSTTFAALQISNTGSANNNIVSLSAGDGAGSQTCGSLSVTGGIFDQGTGANSVNLVTNGSGTVASVTSGTWQNFGTGDVTLSGDVSNIGTINFNANGTTCGDTADILIRSSDSGNPTPTQRTWTGTGTFSMTDVNVKDQKAGGSLLNPPVLILVNSGFDAGNNTGWTFVNQCTSGTYTWIGGTAGAATDWTIATNWNPTRVTPTNSDVLIFDGNSTPAPAVTNVPTQEIAALRLKNNNISVTLNASGANTLTISGNTGTDLDIPSGTSLTLASGNSLTISLTGSGHECTVAGQLIFQDGAHRLLGSNAGEITMTGTNAFTTAGTYDASTHPFGTGSTNGVVVFQSGATAAFNAGLDPFGGAGKSVVTFDSGSVARFFAASAFSYDGRTYGNLILDGNQTYDGGAGTNPLALFNSFTLANGSSFALSTGSGGDLLVGGDFTDNNTDGTALNQRGRTVKFQGANLVGGLTQTITKIAGSLGNVEISKTEAGGFVQLGNALTINGALLFSGSSSAVDVLKFQSNALSLNGTFSDSTGSASNGFQGDSSASLIVGGTGNLGTLNFLSSARTLGSLTMNRTSSGEMTFGNDMTVGNSVTLTNGLVKMGANTLSLNSAATASSDANSYVTGKVRKTFGAAGTFSFPIGTDNGYSPVDATVAAGGTFPADFTASANQIKEPHIHGATVNALKRYWALTASGITADLTFHYLDPTDIPTDINASYTDANYVIWKYNVAQSMPGGSVNTSANTATISGVTSFSNWTLADAAAVTPGTLSFVGAPYTTVEGNNTDHPVTITVRRSGGSDGAIDVNCATANGTATIANNDYVGGSDLLHWNDGDTVDQTFNITVKGDTTYEANETVNITLSSPTDGATITPPSATTLTINNDDSPAANATFTVNTTDDVDNGACVATHCSLREAINAANALPDANTINFSIPGGDPGCSGGVCTINLTGALADLATDMTISGTGANTLVVKRNTGGDYRIFTIDSGVTATISGLTITNGHLTGGAGAGVYNAGTLELTECAITNNSATGGSSNFGGGVKNATTGTLTITRSEISGNSATGASGNSVGGGIDNGKTLTIVNSTISGNTAQGVGGGVINDGPSPTTTIYNSTIAGNTGSSGGGLFTNNNTLILKSSIVANNTGGGTPDVEGSFTSQGFNLIRDTSGASFTPDATDITGVDPKLGTLQNNGGATQTQALLTGSPALDNGIATAGVTTDQRNSTRPVDDPNRPNAAGGDGSDIGAYESQTTDCPAFTISPSSLPNGTIGVSYSQTISASGGTGPYTFAVTSGSLPNGITLDSSGSLSGTPTTNGTSNFTVTALDADLCGTSKAYSLTIDCPTITVSPSSLPNGITGNSYNDPLSASGGTGPYTFAITGGAQPTGLSLNTNGTWSGTPSSVNTFNFDVTATDNIGCIGTRHYTVVITSCPTTLTVNNTGDTGDAIPGDGICDDGAGHCTLRAAIQESNALGACAPLTIGFSLSLPATIVVGTELDVTRSVNISGPGANQLAVSGGDTSRLFVVGPGTVSITGINATHGKATGGGAAVDAVSGATVNLIEVAVTHNVADTGGSSAAGAGVYCNPGCAINLIRSEVSGNSITGSGNSVGGGVYDRGSMTIVNSTISGNSASGVGGGIFAEGGSSSLAITNATITNNSSSDFGGGIAVFGFNATLRNTIVANNTASFGQADLHSNLGGSFTSLGHNLVRDPSGYTPDATDINNQDPKLDALSNYGGGTQTHRLQTASPALEAGDNCVFDNSCSPPLASALTTDQRGAGFARKLDANSDGVAVVDIGAVEADACTIPPATPTASNTGPYCAGATISLSTPTVAGATYGWTGPNGFVSSLQNPTRANATTADAGTYSVTVTVSGCTSAAGTTNVVVNANAVAPTLSYTSPQTVTEGNSLNITTATGPSDDSSVSSIVLQDAGGYPGTISVDNATGVVTVSNAVSPGSYTITIRATDSCSNHTDATFTLTVNAAVCTNPPSGMVAWYPGDGNADNIMGGPSGTLQNNATFAAGKVNQAFTLNGTNQYVDVGDIDLPSTFTIDAWVYGNSFSNQPYVVSKGDGSHNTYYLAIETTGAVDGELFNGTSFTQYRTAPNAVVIGSWQHIALTYDAAATNGQRMKVYVNGVNVPATASVDNGGAPEDNALSTKIGIAANGSAGAFNGLIDEVELFNTALDVTAVKAIYDASFMGKCRTCTPAPSGLVGWWSAEDNAIDRAASHNGTFAAATYAPGMVGRAFSFDGVDALVDVADQAAPGSISDFGANDFTIDTWVNFNGFGGGGDVFLAHDPADGGPDKWIFWHHSGNLELHINNAGNGVFIGVPWSPATGQWYHVAITRSGGSTYRFYVDGSQIGDDQTNATAIPDVAASLTIGKAEAIPSLNGLLDEVEVFNRALSQPEIAAIADAGSAGKCPLAPTILVKGNGQTIADGSTSPSATNDTDFGNVTVGSNTSHTFTIFNTGNSALNVSSISFTGTNATEFSAGALTPGGAIAGGDSASFSVTFTPGATGTRTATLHIASNDASTADYDFAIQGDGTATPNNPPVVSAPSDQSSNEGSSQSFDLGSFSDPDADAPWSVQVNWGDDSSPTSFNVNSTGLLGSKSHTYADNGAYQVTVTVNDNHGGSDSKTFNVTVNNVAPTISINGNSNVPLCSPFKLNFGSVNDPGADTVSQFTVDWGDSTNNTYSGSPSAFKTHTYAATGTFTIKVSLTDEDGTYPDVAQTQVTVDPLATATSITNQGELDTNTVVGQPYTVKWQVAPSESCSTTVTGTVTITVAGSSETCNAPVGDGQCSITPTTAGTKQITATYAGDGNYNGSASSPASSHGVDKANTTSTITNVSDLGDSSLVGNSYVVQWSVTVDSPGSGTPTGTVTVTGGSDCNAPVADGQCTITSTDPGGKSLVATYSGDDNFTGSTSSSASHVVNSLPTSLVVNSTGDDDDFDQGNGACETAAGNGICTLRAAMEEVNALRGAGGTVTISFNIPVDDPGHVYYKDDVLAGVSIANVTQTSATDDSAINDIDPNYTHSWWRIKPQSDLPEIEQSMIIDGYTQGASTPLAASRNTRDLNDAVNGDDAVLRIEVDGENIDDFSNGFDLFSNDGCTISGLVINNFQSTDIYAEDGGGDTFTGNFIGIDVSGTLADGTTASGIYIDSGDGSLIGGDDPGDRNIISGRTDVEGGGILIFAGNTDIEGNFIGTDRTGKLAISNSVGVVVGGDGNFIGCEVLNGDNVISGNLNEGILISYASGNLVEGNFIGTDNTGQTALVPTNSDGVKLAGVYAQSNFIGVPGFPNVISGNGRIDPDTQQIIGGNGIEITDSSSGNIVESNLIGVAFDGTTALGNLQNGVEVYESAVDNVIGPVSCDCTDRAQGLGSGGKTNQARANQIRANQARVNLAKLNQARANQAKAHQTRANQAKPNPTKAPPGKSIQAQANIAKPSSKTRRTVNDLLSGGNVVAFNGLDGVRVTNLNDVNNQITQNSIYSNGCLGINLVADGDPPNGVTLNDLNDGDSDPGPNNLQNFPVIINADPGSTTVSGTLDSAVDGTFTIEVFANDSCDSSGYGEGKTFLGSATATQVSPGQYTFTVTISDPLVSGQVITSTATDDSFNTSEFSQCFTVPPPVSTVGVAVSPASVLEDSGNGLVYTFTRDQTSGPLTVNFDVGGTATFGGGNADYTQSGAATFTSSSGTVTFADGSGTATVTVTPILDTTMEPDETVVLTVTSGAGYNVDPGNASATGTITNDDCPTTFVVNSLADTDDANPGDGHCDIDSDPSSDQCTLRAAIQEANALPSCGAINIVLTGVSGSINLSTVLPAIDHDVNLKGPAANVLTVQRNSASAFRIFNINPNRVVSISGLTITNGADSTGGGIYNNHGALTIDGCEITGNSATAEGAGIYNGGATSGTATLTITNSTISNNSSAIDGGGVDSEIDFGSANLTMTNCTVSGNTANRNGGGVYVVSSPATLTNVTITNNHADNDTSNGGLGGGLGNSSGTVTLRNTLVAGNFRGSSTSTRDDVNGALQGSSSYNLVGDDSGMSGISNGIGNNQVGSSSAPIIPYLGLLIYNGGTTRTHGLLYNSPAIDAGDPLVVNSPLFVTKDQRGLGRPSDGDNNGTNGVDIGAYERQKTEERFAPVGTSVGVDINDVRLTFPSVTNVQPQTVELTVNAVPNDAPAGSGPVFDIHPTSNFYTPPVTMCFYLPAITNPTTFASIKIYHREDGVLVERTEQKNFPNKTVCINDITSFSQFVINQPVTPTVANGNISGQILDNNGMPVEGAAVRMSGSQSRLTITDAGGNYHFDDVDTNGLYILTPSRSNFTFSPVQRTFTQLGAHTEATFTGAASATGLNPLDTTEYFVRQQYLDFLGREPDDAGFNFWVNNIDSCGADANCREAKRVDTSAAFFLSIEFQQTGYLVYRAYESAYGNLDGAPVPMKLSDFKPDTREISNGVVVLQDGWQQKLEDNKRAFIAEFVQRLRFSSAYPTTMTPAQFVDKLFANARVSTTEPDYAAALAEFGTATDTSDAAARARVLRRIAENSTLTRQQFNTAFVLMQYFGYLQRDPNTGRDTDFTGYNFWLDKLNRFNGNFENAEMVKAFLTSSEYRARFPR